LTKYIFSSVTNLFSDNVAENFIVLATFANKESIKKVPAFAESIQTDADFLEIQKNMNEKWWHALDSRSILDNDTNKLTNTLLNRPKNYMMKKLRNLGQKELKSQQKY